MSTKFPERWFLDETARFWNGLTTAAVMRDPVARARLRDGYTEAFLQSEETERVATSFEAAMSEFTRRAAMLDARPAEEVR